MDAIKRLLAFAAPLLCFALQSHATPSIELMAPVPISGESTQAMLFAARTPVHKLRQLFDGKAREPEPKHFQNWKSGRCFFPDKPMQPVPALLTTYRSNQAGPLFEDETHMKILPLIARGQPADFFDKLQPKTRTRIGELLKKHQNDVAYAVRTNGTLRVDVPRSLELEARQYSFRAGKEFLYMRLTCSDAGGCRNANFDRIFYTEDETAAYCYFFRDVGR